MRKRIAWMFVACALHAGPAISGPLTDLFLESLRGYGTATWSEGYQEERVETLRDVILRMEDGRRYGIGTLTLSHEGSSILLDAEDVRMNPEDDILLLKAGHLSFRGHAGLLERLWALDLPDDGCAFVGPETVLRIDDFGMILSGPDDFLSQDRKYRADEIQVSAKISGNDAFCAADLGFSLRNYEAGLSDGSVSMAESLDLAISIPGSLSSLAADPGREVTFGADVRMASSLIPGGATAWAIRDGSAEAAFTALGLVPALTLTLKHRDGGFGPKYWMEVWNTLSGLRGTAAIDVDDMTLRSANILPTEYVTRFADAGLTTLLLDLDGQLEIADGAASLVSGIDATGLMDAAIEADFRIGRYPPGIIARQDTRPGTFDRVPPIHLDRLHYAHTDDGLIDSAASIMGVPVTVRINQVRDHQVGKHPEIAPVIGRIATEVARFAAFSYRNPPARLDLSIGEGLDLREALLVASKIPQDIPKIFSFSVGGGQKEGME